ncbi:MAG: hypothetical protein CVU44_20730 [Chloroflexi bacterium HGW-Chloroflexi-6]|nr:MAG: hypothetical protein CVU44_20730 [Chloroflexi bacterium HGW-Chloroflexi-6]
MVKSGLIVGAILFVLVLMASSILSPFCALCFPLFAGLGAGYLAGQFEKPLPEDALKRGALAGALAGGIAIFAQFLAALINAIVLQNPQFNPGYLFGTQPIDPALIWVGQIGGSVCIGLLNIGLMAGFGALGGLLWRKTVADKQVPTI